MGGVRRRVGQVPAGRPGRLGALSPPTPWAPAGPGPHGWPPAEVDGAPATPRRPPAALGRRHAPGARPRPPPPGRPPRWGGKRARGSCRSRRRPPGGTSWRRACLGGAVPPTGPRRPRRLFVCPDLLGLASATAPRAWSPRPSGSGPGRREGMGRGADRDRRRGIRGGCRRRWRCAPPRGDVVRGRLAFCSPSGGDRARPNAVACLAGLGVAVDDGLGVELLPAVELRRSDGQLLTASPAAVHRRTSGRRWVVPGPMSTPPSSPPSAGAGGPGLGAAVHAVDPAGPAVSVAGGPPEGFDLVVGADGLHSPCRLAHGGWRRPLPGDTCWRGVAPDPGLETRRSVVGPRSRIGLVPVPGDRVYYFLVRRPRGPVGRRGPRGPAPPLRWLPRRRRR